MPMMMNPSMVHIQQNKWISGKRKGTFRAAIKNAMFAYVELPILNGLIRPNLIHLLIIKIISVFFFNLQISPLELTERCTIVKHFEFELDCNFC
jgi:hypothetical protein